MVKVYSITVCPWCDKVKKYLKYRGIAYQEYNIEHDPAALEACRKLSGDTIVPVTTADDAAMTVRNWTKSSESQASPAQQNHIVPEALF